MGQTSIPCTTDARDRLAAMKPEDMNWSEFLFGLAEDGEVHGRPDVDGVAEELQSINSALETVEQRTGNIERTLENLQR
jgi:hypothetical protein